MVSAGFSGRHEKRETRLREDLEGEVASEVEPYHKSRHPLNSRPPRIHSLIFIIDDEHTHRPSILLFCSVGTLSNAAAQQQQPKKLFWLWNNTTDEKEKMRKNRRRRRKNVINNSFSSSFLLLRPIFVFSLPEGNDDVGVCVCVFVKRIKSETKSSALHSLTPTDAAGIDEQRVCA